MQSDNEKTADVERRSDPRLLRIMELFEEMETESSYEKREIITRKATKVLLELEAALAAMQKVSEWLPIESAPKDGTQILAAVKNDSGKWWRYIAFYAPYGTLPNGEDNYIDDDSEFAPEGWYHDTSDEERVNLFLPTHWMPLPLPPTTAK